MRSCLLSHEGARMHANVPAKLRSAASFARPKTTHWLRAPGPAHAAALRHQPGGPPGGLRLDCSLVLLSARQLSERGRSLTRSVLESQPENDGFGSRVRHGGAECPTPS